MQMSRKLFVCLTFVFADPPVGGTRPRTAVPVVEGRSIHQGTGADSRSDARASTPCFRRHRRRLRAQQRALSNLEDELSKMVAEGTADEPEVEHFVGKVEAARADLGKMRTMMIFRMRRILTTDQHAEAAEVVRAEREGTPRQEPRRRSSRFSQRKRSMNMPSRRVIVLAGVMLASTGAFARSAMPRRKTRSCAKRSQRYQAGLDALQNGTPPSTPASAQEAARPIRELRLSEVVQLALEKNLDIAVERLNPQSVDLQIAGYPQSVPAGGDLHGRPARPGPPAEQPAERRQSGQQHDDDLQLRVPPVRSAVGRLRST